MSLKLLLATSNSGRRCSKRKSKLHPSQERSRKRGTSLGILVRLQLQFRNCPPKLREFRFSLRKSHYNRIQFKGLPVRVIIRITLVLTSKITKTIVSSKIRSSVILSYPTFSTKASSRDMSLPSHCNRICDRRRKKS